MISDFLNTTDTEVGMLQLGERLKELREKKGMSREDLAQAMNVSRQAVYKWENNKGYPDIENLIRLSELFDVSLDELIKNDRRFQKKISIDKEEELFGDFSEPGFYLGVLFVGVGLFTDLFSDGMVILGLLTIVFYDDFKKLLKRLIKDFKELKKEFNDE